MHMQEHDPARVGGGAEGANPQADSPTETKAGLNLMTLRS